MPLKGGKRKTRRNYKRKTFRRKQKKKKMRRKSRKSKKRRTRRRRKRNMRGGDKDKAAVLKMTEFRSQDETQGETEKLKNLVTDFNKNIVEYIKGEYLSNEKKAFFQKIEDTENYWEKFSKHRKFKKYRKK